MARLPLTNSEVWYAYDITIDNIPVGTLRSFNPTQTRTVDVVREIATNGGQIVEIVPGVTDYTIRLEKVRLYNKVLFDYFGIVTKDLQNQIRPVDIKEAIHHPQTNLFNNAVTGPPGKADGNAGISYTTYENCWLTDWGKTISTGAITNVETMTARPTRIV